MKLETFFEKFEQFADAPGAVAKVRVLVLDLALQGKVTRQLDSDDSVENLLEDIHSEKVSLVDQGLLKKASQFEPLPDNLQLPPTWRRAPLAALCISVTDGDHLPPPKAETGVPFLVISDVRWGGIDFTGCRRVSEEYFAKLDWIRKPQERDILYTLVGSFGIPVVVRDSHPFCVQRHIGILRPSRHIELQYLAHALASELVFRQAALVATGIAQKTVPLSGLRKIVIPLPPLAEQKRIVAKVDELMALCDRLEAQQQERETQHAALARASLARFANAPTPANLDLIFHPSYAITPADLRKSILTLAVQGKLVPQDPNDEAADECLSRLGLRSTIVPQQDGSEVVSLPPAWARVRFEDVAIVAGGVTLGRKLGARKMVHLPYLRVANVKRGEIDLSVVKEVSIAEDEIERYALRENDLLMTEGGDWDKVGRAAIWRAEIPVCLHQNHVFRARMRSMELTPFWFESYFNSPIGRGYFESASKQTTNLASINMRQVRSCPIPLPPLAEQRRIVAKVDQLMALVDTLEAQLASSRTTAAKLLAALVAELTDPNRSNEGPHTVAH
jgi:type I restriction enzyme S subunit